MSLFGRWTSLCSQSKVWRRQSFANWTNFGILQASNASRWRIRYFQWPSPRGSTYNRLQITYLVPTVYSCIHCRIFKLLSFSVSMFVTQSCAAASLKRKEGSNSRSKFFELAYWRVQDGHLYRLLHVDPMQPNGKIGTRNEQSDLSHLYCSYISWFGDYWVHSIFSAFSCQRIYTATCLMLIRPYDSLIWTSRDYTQCPRHYAQGLLGCLLIKPSFS